MYCSWGVPIGWFTETWVTILTGQGFHFLPHSLTSRFGFALILGITQPFVKILPSLDPSSRSSLNICSTLCFYWANISNYAFSTYRLWRTDMTLSEKLHWKVRRHHGTGRLSGVPTIGRSSKAAIWLWHQCWPVRRRCFIWSLPIKLALQAVRFQICVSDTITQRQ